MKAHPKIVAEQLLEKIRRLQHWLLSAIVRRSPGLGLEARAETFVRIFEKYLPSKSRILDLGGGWGFYAKPLQIRGHRPVILDVVRPGLQKAPVVLYDGRRIPFPDKSFEASLLITMLHHVPDPDAVIREAKRVTRKVVIVVEDLYRTPLGRLWTKWRDQIYNFEFFGHPGQFKTKEAWTKLFGKHGFELAYTQEIYTRLAGLRILNGVFVFRLPETE